MSARLDELDRTEWADVVRRLCPDITEAELDEKWQRFIELKRQKGLQ